jgi:tungstate transport system ATP-binding protein
MVDQRQILPVKLESVTLKKRGSVLLDSISHDFSANGCTAIMGPNGSGKTSLMRVIHGLEHRHTGSINWAAKDNDQDLRSAQSFVFQTPILMRRSVAENIAYPLLLRGSSKSEAIELANEWTQKIGLSQHRKFEAHMLSGGERQKMALARALVTQPQLLLLDEPTTNLDGSSTREIEALLIQALAEGTRIIMSTHDIGQAKRLATDILFLVKGKLAESAPAVRFFEAPASRQAQAYLIGDIVE